MKKTIISHFYNEQYLLPKWLEHYRNHFDHGVLINYNSFDDSCDIIREMCPSWEIIESEHEKFSPVTLGPQINKIVSQIDEWKTIMNTTEFLIGDFSSLDKIHQPTSVFTHSMYMIDDRVDFFPNLHEMLTGIDNAVHYETDPSLRSMRVIHNHPIEYEAGRHFRGFPQSENFLILYFALAPVNNHMIQRKMQIQNKIPDEEKKGRCGWQHWQSYYAEKNNFDKGYYDELDFHADVELLKSQSSNVRKIIDSYLDKMNCKNVH